MNIIKFLIDEKIATCEPHARNIIAKLHLGDLYNDGKYGEIMTRARAYRDFRNAGEKSDVAARKAIAGEPAPVPLLVEAAHTSDGSNVVLVRANETKTYSSEELKFSVDEV